MLSFTRQATKLTPESTNPAPRIPAVAMAQELIPLKTTPDADPANIKIATPNPAPELIPKTKGPASGFLKKVCICNPLKLSPIPAKMATRALGRR